MDKFDDIPIRELNKAEGYQQQNNPDVPQEEELDDQSLSIFQRIEHTKWKIRMKAYQEISEQFYIQHTKDSNNGNAGDDEQLHVSPYEQFMPYLQKIVSDTNLVA
jgi:hypothetical protein